MANKVLRNLPSVNELLETQALKKIVQRVSHNVVVQEVRNFLEEMRREVAERAEELDLSLPSASELAERIAGWIAREEQPRLRPVVNATGVLLHTGLGRAPLADQAIEAMAAVAGNYTSLEIDPESGQRGQRVQAVEDLLRELTGAEAAAVVNNNAGATLLTLAAVAPEREVIVSRGQLIEIGGSYRLPDVMEAGGARLREVGTTNKTRVSDFDQACGPETAAIMRVHTSNYRIVGFTHQPELEELVEVARKHHLLLIDDIGSGALFDLSCYGLQDEPVARHSIAAGADLVLFSGDKLVGGPQCGIVVGRHDAVARIVKHPLTRALRVGKLTLAALEATLKLHRDQKHAETHIPLFQLLSASKENLKHRAERLASQIAACPAVQQAVAEPCEAQLGGGSVPAQQIPSWCVAITPRALKVDALARRLRLGTPSVFGRLHRDRLLLDLRTVLPRQDMQLIEALQALDGDEEPATTR